ncbi:MAG: phosphotransferase [bacterium]
MTKITFLNQPRASDHGVDGKKNERRKELVPLIEAFLPHHPLFKNKTVNVFFAQKGVSSLVSILDVEDKKLVLKIPLTSNPGDQEGTFLNAWEKVGVSVPHVVEEGLIGSYKYTIMNFVDAENLRDHYKLGGLLRERIFVVMGRTLRKMHTTIADGYGKIIDSKGEYANFKSWILEDAEIKKCITDIKENNLLNETEHGSIDAACKILINYVEANPKCTYCHHDFAPGNIFATDPITIFDPDPMFNNPILDLARAIIIGISLCEKFEVYDQLVDGYFENESYDKKALHAAILFEAYMKIPYYNKTDQPKRLAILREYLKTNKNLLTK